MDKHKHISKIKEVWDNVTSLSWSVSLQKVVEKYQDDKEVSVFMKTNEHGGEFLEFDFYTGGFNSKFEARSVSHNEHWIMSPIEVDVELGAEHFAVTLSNFFDGEILDDESDWSDIEVDVANSFTRMGFPYYVSIGFHRMTNQIVHAYASGREDDSWSSVDFIIERNEEGKRVLKSLRNIEYYAPNMVDEELFYLQEQYVASCGCH
ncbi:hypothetical protein [Paenibacillus alvei]|uniref:hypothetical protein n=1 Tax=Paenibacillus alvei TaxID=44250 RepID=UPI002282B547|nr:hypothetical protein [Paenibacillus alvei]